MKTKFKAITAFCLTLFFMGFFVVLGSKDCFADTNFTVSPMYQKYSFEPGETKTFEFRVYNPEDSDSDFEYELSIEPFFRDSENEIYFSAKDDYSLITNWVTLPDPFGSLKPGEGKDIKFIVSVPKNAPGGGQYVAIFVKTKGDTVGMVNQNVSIAHLLYAEVNGKTIHSGSIENPELSSILFSGLISASTTAINTGNVHAYATQKLTVRSLFGAEIYKSEDSEEQKRIMPESTRKISVEWPGTPSVGIFNVNYTVDFEGKTISLDKLVLVCPLWLLTASTIALVVVVIFVVYRIKKRSKIASL